MHESHWWDIIDTVLHWIGLLLAAAFGWLARKFSRVEDKMAQMDKLCTERGHQAAMNIAVLQSYHESNTQRLDAIDETAKRIDGKLDEVIMSLRKP